MKKSAKIYCALSLIGVLCVSFIIFLSYREVKAEEKKLMQIFEFEEFKNLQRNLITKNIDDKANIALVPIYNKQEINHFKLNTSELQIADLIRARTVDKSAVLNLIKKIERSTFAGIYPFDYTNLNSNDSILLCLGQSIFRRNIFSRVRRLENILSGLTENIRMIILSYDQKLKIGVFKEIDNAVSLSVQNFGDFDRFVECFTYICYKLRILMK